MTRFSKLFQREDTAMALVTNATMRMTDTTLPWNDTRVLTSGELAGHLTDRLQASLRYHLPKSVWLFCDHGVGEEAAARFVEEMALHLSSEFELRERRKARFVKLGHFTAAQLTSLLADHRGTQRWAVYYSERGGLGGDEGRPSSPDRGVIPCSSMRNHGVAWRRQDGELRVWLATARKEGRDWDWDSDIGHESAHAAFAPVPLYMQNAQESVASVSLEEVEGIEDLEPHHLARISYMYSEIGVIAMRGERRATETGLPVPGGIAEVCALLRLSHDLMPDFGFARALAAYEATGGVVDVNESEEIFAIGAPILRALPIMARSANSFAPPSVGSLTAERKTMSRSGRQIEAAR
jgi:hypothetical protein